MKPKVAMAALVAAIMWWLKDYYAEAPVDHLRWILTPTAALVTALTRVPFEWIAGEGFLARERLFLIAKVCAGINFMIAAIGLVAWTLRRRATSYAAAAGVALVSVATAYAAAVVINGLRIAWALAAPAAGASAHRLEGIAVFFCGLVLLNELMRRCEGGEGTDADLLRRSAAPLFWYYAIAIAVPLLNGASGAAFVAHAFYVLAVPPACVVVVAVGVVVCRRAGNRARAGGRAGGPRVGKDPACIESLT